MHVRIEFEIEDDTARRRDAGRGRMFRRPVPCCTARWVHDPTTEPAAELVRLSHGGISSSEQVLALSYGDH